MAFQNGHYSHYKRQKDDKKLTKFYYINRDFIPAEWTDEETIMLLKLRTEIERQFSHMIVVYHARRSNVRGIETVTKHRYLILILDLLKILTAYKVGRPDLIGKTRSFTTTKRADFDSVFPPAAIKEGFQVLLPDFSRSPTFFRMR